MVKKIIIAVLIVSVLGIAAINIPKWLEPEPELGELPKTESSLYSEDDVYYKYISFSKDTTFQIYDQVRAEDGSYVLTLISPTVDVIKMQENSGSAFLDVKPCEVFNVKMDEAIYKKFTNGGGGNIGSGLAIEVISLAIPVNTKDEALISQLGKQYDGESVEITAIREGGACFIYTNSKIISSDAAGAENGWKFSSEVDKFLRIVRATNSTRNNDLYVPQTKTLEEFLADYTKAKKGITDKETKPYAVTEKDYPKYDYDLTATDMHEEDAGEVASPPAVTTDIGIERADEAE